MQRNKNTVSNYCYNFEYGFGISVTATAHTPVAKYLLLSVFKALVILIASSFSVINSEWHNEINARIIRVYKQGIEEGGSRGMEVGRWVTGWAGELMHRK